MRELSELDRIHLVLALQRSTSKEQQKSAETKYVDDLVKQVARPTNQQHAKLTRWVAGCLCWEAGGIGKWGCTDVDDLASLPSRRGGGQGASAVCMRGRGLGLL